MRFILILMVMPLLLGCTQTDIYGGDELSPEVEQQEDEQEDKDESGVRAIVLSEGQYGYSTGSMMSLGYDGSLNYDLFSSANGRGLGDVPQSMVRIGDYYYIAINNSNCIEVIECEDYSSVETMRIPHSCIPMFIVDLGDGVIAVSDQTMPSAYGSSVSRIALLSIDHNDSEREILLGTLDMPVATFEMKSIGGKLFVNCEQFTVFDIDGIAPQSGRRVEHDGKSLSTLSKIVEDRDGYIWVLTSTALHRVDVKSEEVLLSLDLSGLECSYMDIDPSGQVIYLASDAKVTSGGFGTKIYSVEVAAPAAPEEMIFEHDQHDYWTPYGMQVSREGSIFVIRVLYGSITRARIFEYSSVGEVLNYYGDFYGVAQPYFSAGVFSSFIYLETV